MEFDLDDFASAFPYGFLGEREGEYVNRVEAYLSKLPAEKQSLVIDLLDLQWLSYVQQLWLISDETGNEDPGRVHFVLARMQINSNIRRDHGLPHRNIRDALYRFSFKDVLYILENAADVLSPLLEHYWGTLSPQQQHGILTCLTTRFVKARRKWVWLSPELPYQNKHSGFSSKLWIAHIRLTKTLYPTIC